MTDKGGHVFMVHGRIESVVHDFALVPTASAFSVRKYWEPLIGGEGERFRPDGWPTRQGFARAKGRPDIWFINVGSRDRGPGVVADRAVRAIREMAALNPSPSRNRKRAVVAVPVLGIGGGGRGHERGDVVRELLKALEVCAAETGLDIAAVTPDASVYGAAQHLRRGEHSWPLPDVQLTKAEELGQLAREGGLALFMGAGVSIPAGLPTWSQLLEQLAGLGGEVLDEAFRRLTPLDQAQLLSNSVEGLGRHVARIVSEAQVPSLSHAFLASLGCREAVTTNYDRLYEKAVGVQRGPDNVATVMPWQPPQPGRPWVLKLHGDIEDPDNIVLTRQQFVSFDAETRPAGALLQTLLMTRHVLFVGASLNDDNVIRLAYEVDRFRRKFHLEGQVGTLLDVEDDRVRHSLWSGQLSWLAMSGADVAERSRTLEVFLDAVAAHASSNASWLLDERFRGLVGAESEMVHTARRLYQSAAASGPEWQALADSLATFGAASGSFDPTTESRRWRHQGRS